MNTSTFQIVAPDLYVPPEAELERQIRAFMLRMRQNLDPSADELDYRQKLRAKELAGRVRKRRLDESGLAALKEEQRAAITDLARRGARIVGPDTPHQVDEWAAEVHGRTPWMGDLTALLMRCMRSRICDGQPGLSIPPLLIVGEPGNGKSWYAHMIAELVGAPFREIDVGAGSAAFRISGLEKGWSSASAGIPVETVLQYRIANPVLIVNEICKSPHSIGSTNGSVSSLTTALLQMLEIETASRFECPAWRVRFDFSRLNWILTANDIDRVAAPLRDRCTVFRMPTVTDEIAAMMFDTLSRDFPMIDPEALGLARTAVLDAAERGHVSLRQIRRILLMLAAEPPQTCH